MSIKNVKGKDVNVNEVKRFMMRLLRTTKDFVDESGADIASLADAAADHFDIYEPGLNVPSVLHGLAHDAVKEVELSK